MSRRAYLGFRLLSLAAWMVPLGSHAPLLGETPSGRVKIEYVVPKDPALQSLYHLLRVQRLFSPFRLPTDLTIQTLECDGIANAWYERAGVDLPGFFGPRLT
jgi:hypothetical protein